MSKFQPKCIVCGKREVCDTCKKVEAEQKKN